MDNLWIFIRHFLRVAFSTFMIFLFSSWFSPASWGENYKVVSKLDLNSAQAQQLAALEGVSPKKAELIVNLRKEKPFVRITELLQVKGIGLRTLEKIEPYLVVKGLKKIKKEKAVALEKCEENQKKQCLFSEQVP